MKRRSFHSILPVTWITIVLVILSLFLIFLLSHTAFYIAAIVIVPVLIFCVVRQLRFQHDVRRYMLGLADSFSRKDREALESIPMPVALIADNEEILWYNYLFRTAVLGGTDAFGTPISQIFDGLSAAKLAERFLPSVSLKDKTFSLFTEKLRLDNEAYYVLYCTDITELTDISNEYHASRPVVLSLFIDSGEEVLKNLRDSDRARLISQVEAVLEDWVAGYSGTFKKCGSYRYIALVEQRDLQQIQEQRFNVLDTVRALPTTSDSITLSIGVGRGKTFAEAEEQSRQALDMSLGRGGDQAAVKTKNGFDFYGGVSKSVERRAKVRPRVVASALQEMIQNSDNVLLMGHRYSDLDALGSAAALAMVCRSVGKTAYVVYDPATTLATALVNRYILQGNKDLFIEVEDASPLLSANTLLIITDIHQPSRLDFPELYHKAHKVAVIDHHRKMVEHIDNALLFYHEPYASSTAEMTAELVQYMSKVKLSRLDAEALLAGIMLDTRHFVMKSGVRTFEAAAFLRKAGADTVEVKRMFSEDMSMYQRKAEIMSSAELYCNMAIAFGDIGGTELRIAASQAADELLSVRDVDASFVLFCENGGVNISARSFGAVNVQLVMEALGGGGHQTMAGTFLKDITMDEAKERLRYALDVYKREQNKKTQ